jgi:hypothetical protein
MWSGVLAKPLQGTAYYEMRSQLVNCLVQYDDDAERRATHPDLLPEGGWSDPEDDSRVLKKAVQLMALERTMTRRAMTPSGHRRSVLGRVPVAQQATHAHTRMAPAKVGNAGGQTALLGAARALGKSKPPAQDSVRRNKYVLALWLAHRKAPEVHEGARY